MSDQDQPTPSSVDVVNAVLGRQVPGWELSDIAEAYAPDYVNHTGPDGPGGFDTHAAWMERIGAFADVTSMDVLAVFGDGEWACVLSRTMFSPKGADAPIAGIGMTVMRVVDGAIVENWGGYEPAVVEAFVRWEGEAPG
ncbi:MAG: nuclear transport factor 2 family protein [Actinomycetota bacterium]